jgi:AcrR family transcriptional regulator
MPISDAPRVQLPRGKHRLTREQVTMSQRLRMLDALANATAEKGYARTTVADVLARSGVSRATFYEHFRSKEEAFLAAYEAGVDVLLAGATEELAIAGDDPLAGSTGCSAHIWRGLPPNRRSHERRWSRCMRPGRRPSGAASSSRRAS